MNAYGLVWTSSYKVVICVCQDLNKRSQIQKVPEVEESLKNISLMCFSSLCLFHSLWKREASVLKVVFNQAVEKKNHRRKDKPHLCVVFPFISLSNNKIKRSRNSFFIKEHLIINCYFIHLHWTCLAVWKQFNLPVWHLRLKSFSQLASHHCFSAGRWQDVSGDKLVRQICQECEKSTHLGTRGCFVFFLSCRNGWTGRDERARTVLDGKYYSSNKRAERRRFLRYGRNKAQWGI